jgi:undecaprenyl-diphosphatase
MFESIILGAVQGIAEWLPVSSEAMIILVKNNFFPSGMAFSEMISFAIFLHLGTLLAAVVYFWDDVIVLMKSLFSYRKANPQQQKMLVFIVIATAVSGALGVGLLEIVEQSEHLFANQRTVNGIVAGFLLLTALILFANERRQKTGDRELSTKRSIITGIFQGLAVIPGISRSGITLASMGLLGIEKSYALKLSFLLSIPLVLFANIFLHAGDLSVFSLNSIVALISAFIVGIISIHVLLKIIRKIRFSYFVGMFALVLVFGTILS